MEDLARLHRRLRPTDRQWRIRALRSGHIANGVDQVPQFIGNAILLQIRNVVTQTQECGMRIDRLSRRRPLPAQEKHQIDILQRMLDWYDRHLN